MMKFAIVINGNEIVQDLKFYDVEGYNYSKKDLVLTNQLVDAYTVDKKLGDQLVKMLNEDYGVQAELKGIQATISFV